jgi:hypothetical protein
MPRKLEELAAEALQLGLESRAALAKTLLESLDLVSPEEHERLWVEEAASRYEELRHGRLSAVDSDTVFSDFQARLRP